MFYRNYRKNLVQTLRTEILDLTTLVKKKYLNNL